VNELRRKFLQRLQREVGSSLLRTSFLLFLQVFFMETHTQKRWQSANKFFFEKRNKTVFFPLAASRKRFVFFIGNQLAFHLVLGAVTFE